MWLRLKPGDTVHGAIDFSSVHPVAKHWTGQRSVPCLSNGCPYCAQGNPVRWRYQGKVIIKGTVHDWEFGEEVMCQLQGIYHQHHYAHVTITRYGEGRNSRYTVVQDLARPDRTTEIIARNLKYQQGGSQCHPDQTRDTTSASSHPMHNDSLKQAHASPTRPSGNG